MRAVGITPDHQVHVTERPDPVPGPGEVLVQVGGAALNRADLAQRAGFYAAPAGSPADIPGVEFAGEVVGHGEGVDHPALGARVFGIVGGGGQAELVTVPATQCAPVPDNLDLVTAGAVPEVFMTAHDALMTQAEMRSGEVLLVHAVGSGVGTAAVQLGRARWCRWSRARCPWPTRRRPTTCWRRTRRSATSCSTSRDHPIRIMTRVGFAARSTRNGRTPSSPITQFTVSWPSAVVPSGSSRTISRWW